MIKQKNNTKKIFVGVAWPYVNGDLHPGHLGGYLLPADVFSRYHRMRGDDVLMVSGSDCHGTPIVVEADKQNKSPREIAQKYHQKDLELFRLFGLDYNLYTSTITENHAKISRDIFLKLLENGYIIKDKTKQYYSVEAEKFLPDRYVEGQCPYCQAEDQRSDQCEVCGRWLKEGEVINPKNKLSGEKVILKETEHYFLELEKFEKEIKEYIEDRKKIWKKWVAKEALGWISEGLKKRAITRDLDWGILLPEEEIKKMSAEKQIADADKKRLYVWFEAVIGYLSASVEWAERKEEAKEIIFKKQKGQSLDWQDWWKNDKAEHYYFMGQDNLVFHTIMWPTQLLGLRENHQLPTNVVVNKFMNYEGKKFSKSKNWTIDSVKLAEKYGVDEVRFYVLSILPENKTSNFSYENLEEVVNNELVAILGNFFNRVLKVLENKFERKIDFKGYVMSEKVKKEIEKTFQNQTKALEDCKFVEGLECFMNLAKFGNRFVEENEIWKIEKDKAGDEGKTILLDAINLILNLGYLFHPYMPIAGEKLLRQLGEEFSLEIGKDLLGEIKVRNNFSLKTSTEPLFKKIRN